MPRTSTESEGSRILRIPVIRTAGLLVSLALITAACGGTTTSTEAEPATTASTAAPASSTTSSTLPATSTTAGTVVATTAPATTTTSTTVPATSPIDAETLISLNCSACLGAELEGGVGPALKGGHGGDHDTAELIEVITNGENGMPAWGGILSSDEIVAIVAYLEELNAHE